MSQTDNVVLGIREMILRGELSPGDRLPPENDLATLLGVSRGSLREGVRALSMMGVVEVRQGAGTFVSSLDAELLLGPMEFLVELHNDDVLTHLHSARRVLETEAAGLAAGRITAEHLAAAEAELGRIDELLESGEFTEEIGLEVDMTFHRLVARAGGNPILSTLIEALSSQTVRSRMWRAIAEEGVAHRTHREHRAILDALRAGDSERARLRMAMHLLGVEDFVQARPHADGADRADPAPDADPDAATDPIPHEPRD